MKEFDLSAPDARPVVGKSALMVSMARLCTKRLLPSSRLK